MSDLQTGRGVLYVVSHPGLLTLTAESRRADNLGTQTF